MSQLYIQQCLNSLATLKKVSGATRETVVREAFKDLLRGHEHALAGFRIAPNPRWPMIDRKGPEASNPDTISLA
jgi:hypothetical protein